MYSISKIEATNFMCYKKLDLDLSNAQNIIIKSDQQENSNGWGKSTVIEAICWVMYEKLLRGGGGKVELKDVISIGESEVKGAIELKDDSKSSVVRIERYRSEKNKYVKMFLNGVEREFDKKTDLNLFISDWLGLDYDGFTRRVLSPENISFLNLTSAERFYTIANLINFNWDKVWNNVQNKLKACKSEMDMLEGELQDLKLKIIKEEGDVKLYQSQTDMLKDQQKVLENKRDKARDEYSRLKAEVEKLEEKIDHENGEMSSITATEQLINEAFTAISKKRFELDNYHKFQSQRETIEAKQKTFTSELKALEEKCSSLQKDLETVDKSITVKATEVKEKESEREKLREAREQIKTKLWSLEAQEKEFKKYEKLSFDCPHCKKGLHGELIIGSLREMSKLDYTKEGLESEAKGLDEKIASSSFNITASKQSHMDEIKKQAKLNSDISACQREITNTEREQGLNEKMLKDFPEKPSFDYAKLDKESEKENIKLLKIKEKREAKQKEMEKIKAEIWSNKTTLNSIIIEGKELSKAIEDIEDKIKKIPEVDVAVMELEKKKARQKDLTEKLEKVKNYYNAYTIVKQGVQPSSQARMNAISRLLPHIAEGVTRLMSSLLQENINIKFDFSDKKLDIICDTYNLRTLSTGQRRCFDIAIATTIQEIAQKTSKNQIGFFIADELFDGLDQNRIYLVMSLLQNLKIPEMFIISHRQEAQELLKTLPNVSNILVKRSNSTSIAEVENGNSSL